MSQPYPFIATQDVYRYDLSDEQRANAREWILGGPGAGRFIENSEEADGGKSTNERSLLQPVSRFEYLADPSHRWLCITEGAGRGKSCLLEQLQLVRQSQIPGHLVFRYELKDLPNLAAQFVDDDFRDYRCSLLVKTFLEILSEESANRQITRSGLPSPEPHEVRSYLRQQMMRGNVTLCVDGLDQESRAEGEQKTAALKAFLKRYPRLLCAVAGRPYALGTYWETLFGDGRDHEHSAWEFCQVGKLTTDELKWYLDDRWFPAERAGNRYEKVLHLGAEILLVPRSLRLVFSLPYGKLNELRTASDLYWRNVNETLEIDVSKSSGVAERLARPTQIRKLLALIAFGMVAREGGPVTQISRDEFDQFVEHELYPIAHLAISGLQNWEDLRDRITRVISINCSYVDGAFFRGMQHARDLHWNNATLRDFLAARWLVRYADEACREKMLRCLPRDESSSRFSIVSGENLDYHSLWSLASESRFTDAQTEYLSLFEKLFEPCKERRRPTELLYRAWRILLHLSNPKLAWDEAKEQIETQNCQQEVMKLVAGGKFDPVVYTGAQRVMYRWLAEYPKTLYPRDREPAPVSNSSASGFDIAWHFEKSFQQVPKSPDASLVFWYGNPETKQRKEIGARFRLNAETVTNQLIRLFDPQWPIQTDQSDRAPATGVNWYDAWCVSTWLHGYLPSEVEWEYACRAQPGAEEQIPHRLWHFGDRKSELERYAWYGDVGGQAQIVGQKLPNAFRLFDMHGNVWEWCRDWYDATLASRVRRGGSFVSGADYSRCSYRLRIAPAYAFHSSGVRVARA